VATAVDGILVRVLEDVVLHPMFHLYVIRGAQVNRPADAGVRRRLFRRRDRAGMVRGG